MITKFEKKLIAGFMAVVMCLSIVLINITPVRAEDASVIAEESAADVQQPSVEPPVVDLEQPEFVETPLDPVLPVEPKPEEPSPGIPVVPEKPELPSPGIPVVPEKPELPLPEMPEVPEKPAPEVEEKIETIHVTADGTTVRTEVKGQQDVMSRTFALELEKDGEYFIHAQQGYVNGVYKQLPSGEYQYVNGTDEIYTLECNDTYYVEVLLSNWEAKEILDISKVQELSVDGEHLSQKTEIKLESETIVYQLNTKNKGLYEILLKGDGASGRFINEFTDSYLRTNTLVKLQEKNYLKLHWIPTTPEGESKGTISWEIKPTEHQEISENEWVTTKGTEESRNVYYQFVPKQDGTYYCSSSSCRILDENMNIIAYDQYSELIKGKTYYIEKHSFYEDETWKIVKVNFRELVEGKEIHTTVGGENEVVLYEFNPTVSGIYGVSGEAAKYVHYLDENKSSLYPNVGLFEEGKTYYIKIDTMPQEEKTFSWSILMIAEVSAALDTLYEYHDGYLAGSYTYVPEETGKYKVQTASLRCDILDSNGQLVNRNNWNGDYSYDLNAGEQYYLFFKGSGYWKLTKKNTETVEKEIAIKPNVSNTHVFNDNESITYTFVPEETGRYHVKGTSGGSIAVSAKDPSEQLISQVYNNYNNREIDAWYFPLKAGNTYEIKINKEYPWDKDQIIWKIEKGTLATAEIEKDYITKSGERTYYSFVPDATSVYMIQTNARGNAGVYDEQWVPVAAEAYNKESGFGAKVKLEQGKTYYIDIISYADSMTWSIQSEKIAGDYSYQLLSNGNVEILKYHGTDVKVDIPSQIEGKDVEYIAPLAFERNETIEEVKIPSKVTEIQYFAFASCNNLQKVVFENKSKLKNIGQSGFNRCGKLSEINLPKGLESIGNYAFSGCTSLADVQLDDQLVKIGSGAFSNSAIKSIHIPDSVVEVGDGAFSYTPISHVVLGTGMEGIPDNTFSNCRQLKEIVIPESMTYIGEEAFSRSGLQQIDIPDSVTSIGENAFNSCQSLVKAKIGNKITHIGNGAFSNCALTEVVLGNKLESVGKWQFSNNKKLTSITVPNSVTKIEYAAFMHCSNLENIELPDSVEEIEGKAFGDTVFHDGYTAWYKNQPDGDVYAGKVYYNYKGTAPEGTIITLKSGTKGVADYALLQQKGVQGVEIPDTVTNIGEKAFLGCSIKEVTIPESVKKIGNQALGYLAYEPGMEIVVKVEGFTIKGVPGTVAEEYATEHGFTFVPIEPSKPQLEKGDVNGDKIVDQEDLQLILRFICGKQEFTEEQMNLADFDDDQSITVKDARLLVQMIQK